MTWNKDLEELAQTKDREALEMLADAWCSDDEFNDFLAGVSFAVNKFCEPNLVWDGFYDGFVWFIKGSYEKVIDKISALKDKYQ